jgi:PAS domain S-box-containing protein
MTASPALWSTADVASFVTDYYNAWSGTDEDLILSYYADDVVLQIPGLLMEGREALRDQFVRPFITAFPGNCHLVKSMTFGPGVVVVEFSFEAKHTGPFAGHAATGARINLPGCGVYEYDGERRQITAGRIYFDVGTLLQTITDTLVDDREKATEALRTNERNLSLITNVIPTFIHVLRPDGTVLYANQAVLGYTGLTLEDVRKEDYRTRCFHPEDVERLREERREALTHPVPFENEQRVRGKDGRYRWFLIRYNPLLDEQGRIDRWYVAAFDIEDRKRAEDALVRQAGVRADVSDAFSKSTHLGEILHGAAEAIVRHLDAAFAGIWTLSKDESTLELQASAGMYTRLNGSYSRIPVGDLKVGSIAREKKAHFTNDVLNDSRVKDKAWAQDNGMVAFAGYPLLVEDRVIGVVALFARHTLSESVLETLASVADTIAQGIERKRAEQALLRSETYLAEAQRLSKTGSFAWSPISDTTYYSEECYRVLGFEPQEGPPPVEALWQRVHPDDQARCREVVAKAVRDKVDFEVDYRVVHPDKTVRDIHGVGHLVLDRSGEVVEHVGTVADITERKRAEEALRNALEQIQESESNLRQVIDTIPALAWCNLPDGPNEFLSKGWHEYTGLSEEQSHGWGWQAAFHPDDLPPLMEKWTKMLSSGEPDEIEARLRRQDGVYHWFLIRAHPFRDESGTIVRWYGTSTDIDDRKRAEALLAGEKRLLEMVAAGRPLPEVLDALCRYVEDGASSDYCSIYLIDPSGTRFQNAAAPRLPSSFNDPIDGAPVDRETGPCGEAACLKTQVVASDVASDPRWPGSFRPHALAHGLRSCWSTPILSLAGEVLGTFAIYRREPASPTPLEQDLIARFTHIASIAIERAHREAALKRSEALLAEAQQLGLTGTFTWRVATDEITWSDQLYRIYEIEVGEPVTPDLIRTRVHPEDVTLLEKMRMVHQAGSENTDFEWHYRLLMPDSSIKYLHAVAHATDQDGQLEYIAAVQDVTARQVAEEALNRARSELAHMARVTTLSALTASIAHEINQPISAAVTSAGACLRWLDRKEPDVQRAREAAVRIEEDGRRAAEIIAHVKSLYKKDVAPEREPVSVNHLVGEMLLLLRSEADRHSVEMRTELAADLPSVSADRVQLQQVLMNLMLNGMEAMSARAGALTISARGEDGTVLVSVSDTGVGIPADKLDDIFNAFVTTKVGGTGMGLAISRTIIEAHGGRLWATANPEAGATLHLTLPTHPMPQ